MNAKPISEPKQVSQFSGYSCLFVFGLVFSAAGAFFFWMAFLSPYLQTRASADWQQTDCEITFSEVDVDNSGDGTTYRPKVEFTYSVDGREYSSDTYDFAELNRSRSECKRIVAAYPEGSKPGCFYDPEDHSKAVIVRDFDHSWMGFLFPLIFVIVGLGAILSPFFAGKKDKSISGSIKQDESEFGNTTTSLAKEKLGGKSGSPTSTESSGNHPADILDLEWDQPQKLAPASGRWTGFFVVLGFAAFWNGIVSIFIYHLASDAMKGNVEWFPIIFMIPFALIGLLLIGGVFHQFFALFNPKVELALSTGSVSPGGTVDVAWELTGNVSRIKQLTIYAEGMESATYRAGTSSHTDNETFAEILIVDTETQSEFEFGSQTVQIPLDVMHTMEAEKNKITWTIRVRGNIPWWPDVDESFPFRVKPV